MTTKIEDGVALPEDTKTEVKVKKQRGRRVGKTVLNPAAKLLSALKFVAVSQKKIGTLQQQHCAISGNWVIASNGILTAAMPIDEDLSACPQTFQLIDALSKVGEDLAITQLSSNSLAVVSGAFRALIPCAGFEELQFSAPDERVAVIDDRIKQALECVLPLATDSAQHAHFAGVLLKASTAVSTNGFCLVEHWHGIDLPEMLIPKASAVAILKCDKALTGFGYSGSSATFWFEDNSFIKTQLFSERFPNYDIIFNCENLNPWPVPDEFYKAVRYIESFSRSGVVYFENGLLASDEQETEASTYKIEGLPEGMGFNSKYLLMVESSFKKVHFEESSNKAFFFGENSRGCVMGVQRTYNDEVEETQVKQPAVSKEWPDDDIPF